MRSMPVAARSQRRDQKTRERRIKYMRRKKIDTTYFIDVESGGEIVRLIDQDSHITPLLGTFPAPVKTLFPLRGEHEYQVLDLACGPGGWALEVALRVPEVEVLGVDAAASMVEYATVCAQVRGRTNARFEQMDVTQRLDLPDGCMQYVHGRFLVGFLAPGQWQPLVQECRRVLAPGGVLCLTESEWPLTTSSAYERLTELTSQALKAVGQSLSPDGRHFGVTPLLRHFLHEAGFEDIQSHAVALDWSIGSTLHTAFCANCTFGFALLRPFVLKAGVTDEATYDRLYEQMQEELLDPSFCGLGVPLVVWGKVPGGTAHEHTPAE